MRSGFVLLFLLISSVLYSQNILTIESRTYVNTETGIWNGVEIPRNVPTTFIFRNNSINSVNDGNYMLLAGDEDPQVTNNNLDGEVITGNKLVWNGSSDVDGCHGIFVGYNKNYVIQYNYLDHVPYGIVTKSGTNSGVNMINTSGGISYNIIRNSYMGVRIKGMNGVSVINNTFFDDMHTGLPGFIYVTANTGSSSPAPSTGTIIKNNIFYLKFAGNIVHLEPGCETGLQCDYNLYYCENGSPTFYYNGATKTFAQWQALGYDTHSIVLNPGFLNSADLVPAARLDYGINPGSGWNVGLSVNAVWGTSDPAKTLQNDPWQVGARIYGAIVAPPVPPDFVSAVIENATPTVLGITFSLPLSNSTPSSSAFTVKVNSVTRSITLVTVSGSNVLITLSTPIVYGDNVTISYTKPGSNPLQTSLGGQAESFDGKAVANNLTQQPPENKPPVLAITSPSANKVFVLNDTIVISASVSDPDGSVKKVEFFNGNVKLNEKTVPPYSYTWKNVSVGNYTIKVVATDNLNAATSASVDIKVTPGITLSPDSFELYPNPNDGHFKINFRNPLLKKKLVTIINYAGEMVYSIPLLRDQSFISIDVSFLSPGIYLLRITGNEILFAEKFLIK